MFEDISMDPPNVSNIETQPLDDTLTDMPPPGMFILHYQKCVQNMTRCTAFNFIFNVQFIGYF